jgi:hypothetical protein
VGHDGDGDDDGRVHVNDRGNHDDYREYVFISFERY